MAKEGDYDFYCDVALKPGADIKKVYESENVLAFHHTKPSFMRHIVVIPKKHIRDIRFVEDAELFKEIMEVCQSIIRKWGEEKLNEKGAKVITNIGIFQDTPHLHFHVVMGRQFKKS
jgi:histidine triad (HIT) family protein